MFDFKLCVCFVIILTSYVTSGKNVLCYYGTWATYRGSWGRFDVSDINTDLCTHVIYAFAGLRDGRIVPLDPWLDLPDNSGRNNYGAFTALKQKNPKLKTILAVGGWNEGSANYSVMASTAANRAVFIDSAVSLISLHGFDGLDLDWEYPNRRDTVHGQADVKNFSLLVKELREVFDTFGWFLSSAVSSVEAMAALSYDVPEIAKHLDMINIMTYDMAGSWDNVTGHNAPLHMGIGDSGDPATLYTVDVALKYWISQGAPLEKLALGIPFYGRTFRLTNPNATSVRDPASGEGLAGPYTQEAGFIGYNEFCRQLESEPWTQEYDPLAMVPYAFKESDWISFDDVASISKKVDYARSLGINNAMVWSIETDDFRGDCGHGDWPLLRIINDILDSTSITTTTGGVTVTKTTEATSTSTETPTTTTRASTTTKSPGTTDCPPTSVPTVSSTRESTPLPTCTKQGSISNPADCSSFYVCVSTTSGELEPRKLTCPAFLHYDSNLKVCNYPELANCILG